MFLPPGLILIAGGLLLPLLPARWRDGWMVLVPLLAIWQIVSMPATFLWHWDVFGWRLYLLHADALSHAFGYVFGIAALLGGLYMVPIKDTVQRAAALVYAGAALAAVYAGDLVTLFVFWELTAVASAFLVWTRRSERAYAVGMRYLLVQVTSGLLLLGGILALQAQGGSLMFDWLGTGDLAGTLILAAFAIKGAFPLLHAWLTEAYPEATPAGAVIMSMLTTKLAMYALVRGYAGVELLVWVGVAGALYALLRMAFENDARRAVCWALIVQLGIITAAIGVGTRMALAGAALHAFAGVFYIGLMLMALGVVQAQAGTCRIDRLGGLYRQMPVTALLFIVGAAALSAVPGFAGYFSKVVLFDALAADAPAGVYSALFAASIGTFLIAGLRLPWLVFFGPVRTAATGEAPSAQVAAMTVAAALCVLFALAPSQFLALLPWRIEVAAWTAGHVLGQLVPLGLAAAVFGLAVILGRLPRPPARTFADVDWVYGEFLPRAVRGGFGAAEQAWMRIQHRWAARGRRLFDTVHRHHGPQGILARSWPTGSMALWVAIILVVALVIYYL